MTTFTDAELELAGRILYSTPDKIIPYLLGFWVDAILLGSLIVMFMTWLSHGYQIERTTTKVLVFYLIIVACGISCFLIASQVYYFADGFGRYRNFLNPTFYRTFFLLSVISRVPAASWFSHRAWLMTNRSIFIPITVIPLLLTSIGTTIGAYATSAPLPLPQVSRNLVTVFTSTGVAVDLINTFTIAMCLSKARTGWRTTDGVISRLLYVTAETQLPPTAIAIAYLICFLGRPDIPQLAFYFQGITKVHVVCLLAVVNSRIKIRAMMGNEEIHELPLVPPGLEISVESYTQTETSRRDTPIPPPRHTVVASKGQTRTVNGRYLSQDGQGNPYTEMHSSTSLV